jgi:hypothetical protein
MEGDQGNFLAGLAEARREEFPASTVVGYCDRIDPRRLFVLFGIPLDTRGSPIRRFELRFVKGSASTSSLEAVQTRR